MRHLLFMGALAALALRTSMLRSADALADALADAPRSSYSAWQHEPARQRYTCNYRYSGRDGRASHFLVHYYPDETRQMYYFFRSRAGRIWGCVIRPGSAEFDSQANQWYTKKSDGRWSMRPAGWQPRPIDGLRRIGSEEDGRLPPPPAPAGFDSLQDEQRDLAERFHRLYATVTVTEGAVTGIDLGGCAETNEDVLRDLGRLTKLRRLYLDRTEIRAEWLRHLAGHKKLVHLDLSDCYFDDGGLKHLATIDNLRTLILRGGSFSQESISALRKACPRLLVTAPNFAGTPQPPAPPPP